MKQNAFHLEHRGQELLPRTAFLQRITFYVTGAVLLIFTSLGVGILGYHHFEHLPWIDAFLNASMILGGMGPVNELHTDGGKIFAGVYALFSGLAFLGVAGLLFTPLLHRLLHRFHFDSDTTGK